MSADLISCVIPAYNAERYLREAIDSAFAQTYQPIEVLVVDDRSTDHTREIVESYGAQVRYLHQANAGPAAARNRGLIEARGDFIAFLDADDLWHTEKLERQWSRLHQREELAYCVTHCQNFWVPELKEEEERYQNHRICRPMPGYVTGTLFAPRAAFETVGPFNENLAHGDSTDWFLRAAERRLLGDLIPEVLMYRRLHSMNRSRLLAPNSREQYLELIKKNLDTRRDVQKTNR